MTYRYLYTLYIIIGAGLFLSCNDMGKWNGIAFNKTSENIKVKSAELKKVPKDSFLEEEEMMFDVSVDVDFMEPKNLEDSLACSNINRYIITQLLNQPDGIGQQEAVNGFIKKKKEDFKADEYVVTCYDHLTGEAEYGLNGVINYTLHEDYYGGGAHPTQVVTIKRFRTATGQPIDLWDIFADSCSTSIKNMLTEKLIAQVGVKNLDELKEVGYLDMVDMFIPNNFWMYQDSLVFFFNQYDIAPYALGQTSLSFSYEELKPYMR